MSEWSLALRNLLRNRRRSLSTLAALAIGLAAILLFGGFNANLRYTMLTAYVRAGGHLQVQHRDYFLYGSGNPTAYGISDYAALVNAIHRDPVLAPMVSVATPMLRFGGLAGNFDAGISRTIMGSGYVADDVNRMRAWNEFGVPIVRAQFGLSATAPDSAIVGLGLARVLQLCDALKLDHCPKPEQSAKPSSIATAPSLPPDIAALTRGEDAAFQTGAPGGGPHIELLSSSATGAPNVAAVNVIAAEDQGFKELDEVSVIIHLTQAQRLVFGRTEPRITAIMVLLKRSADGPAAAARLRQVIDGSGGGQSLVVRSFGELNPFYVQSEQLFEFIFHFVIVLIGGIVLFTVGNTMNTAVVERTVEIGTLRAVGLRRGGVRRLFLIEGFVLGCLGAIAGILAALMLGALINHSGLTWLPPGSSESLPLRLRVLGDVPMLVGSTVGLVLVATLSAWWPARRAANLKMVDALRHA
jgi:putative ABC transport system permease protein